MPELVLALALAAPGSGAGVLPGDPAPGHEYLSGITVALVREGDPESAPGLSGARVAFTAISRGKGNQRRFAGSWYLEWKQSRTQEVLEAGVEVAYPYLRFSRAGLGPRIRAGMQRRSRLPERGLDGVFGLGFQTGVWLSRSVELAFWVDRTVGFRASGRTSAGAGVRIMTWGG